MKKSLLLAVAAFMGFAASAQSTTYYTYDNPEMAPVAATELQDGKTYFIYDDNTANNRQCFRYNRSNAPYFQIVGKQVERTAGQSFGPAYVWQAIKTDAGWKFKNLDGDKFFPKATGAGGNIDMGTTTEEQAGVWSLTAGPDGAFYVRSVDNPEYVWDGNDGEYLPFTFWNAGNGHPIYFYSAAEAPTVAVTYNVVVGTETVSSFSETVVKGFDYTTKTLPDFMALSETLVNQPVNEDKTITVTVKDSVTPFKMVNARYNNIWATVNATGLYHTNNEGSFIQGAWFVTTEVEGGVNMYSINGLSYVANFNQDAQAAFGSTPGVFVVERNQNGPVTFKAESGMYFNEFGGTAAGIIGGWHLKTNDDGVDSGSFWFAVSDEATYLKNAPYYWNDGACRNEWGSFTGDCPWYKAQQAAIDAIAAAKTRGASDEDCAKLQALVDAAAEANFGAAGTDIAKMIEDLDSETATLNSWTSISEISAVKPAARAVYDLQGRKVGKPTRGLYIINGVKTLVK